MKKPYSPETLAGQRGPILVLVILAASAFMAALAPAAPANTQPGSTAAQGADVLSQARQVFGPPLPQVISSPTNPVTSEKVRLGKMLFYETRIATDGVVSCAKCHPFERYAADHLKTSIGNDCKKTPRNAPTILNAAGHISSHWSGNRKDVEDQASQALARPGPFGAATYQQAESALAAISGYLPLFQAAFPGDKDPITAQNFGAAVGAFERTLVTPSPFDEYLTGGKKPGQAQQGGNAGQHRMSQNQLDGLKTFLETGCTGCHNGTYIGGQMYQRFGMVEPYWHYTNGESTDVGRYDVTKQESDRYVFKVPSLRNVEKTAPYFHDGSVANLTDAVWIMGKVQLGKDLAEPEKQKIAAFLASLTGALPDDALKLPILP